MRIRIWHYLIQATIYTMGSVDKRSSKLKYNTMESGCKFSFFIKLYGGTRIRARALGDVVSTWYCSHQINDCWRWNHKTCVRTDRDRLQKDITEVFLNAKWMMPLKRCRFSAAQKPPVHNSFSDYFGDGYLQQSKAQKDLLALPLPKKDIIVQHQSSNSREGLRWSTEPINKE